MSLTVEDVARLVKNLTPQQRARVVHVSHSDSDVYIGDAVPSRGFEQSIWSNQFHCSSKDKADPEKVKASVRTYTEWLLDQINTGEMTIECIQRSLGGRRLGCWCRKGDGQDTKLCHGLVLVALMDHDVEAWF